MNLAKYIFKRLIFAFITLFVLVLITFFLMQIMPGDPFVGQKARSQQVMDAVYRKYGLDKPVIEQFFIYIGNIIKGDFGESLYYTGRNVMDIILEAFPYSFDLGIRALCFGVIGGLCLGIIAGIKRGTKWDTTATIIAIIGISVPSFIIGSLLQYLLSIQLSGWIKSWSFMDLPKKWALLPVSGWSSELTKIMPSFALGLGSLATVSRLMRTSVLDVSNQDYIATAKSKGLSNRQIIFRHTIRNAILPVVTVLGPMAAAVLTGAFVVENIFAIPGLGRFFVISVQNLDYTMICGTTIFYGAFLVVATMLVDIIYGIIDPRIRLS